MALNVLRLSLYKKLRAKQLEVRQTKKKRTKSRLKCNL